MGWHSRPPPDWSSEAGYGLGLAQRESDLWLTVIGTAGLTALSGLLRLYVRREPKQRS
jgi:hypothetical protein